MVGPQAADDFGHSEQDHHESHAPKGSLLALCVGTVGVVFGDIGTSPIYAFRETFAGHHPITPDPMHINGVLSLVFWSMMIVVTFKYVFTIMKADNKGEGGSLALLALINRQTAGAKWTAPFVMLGVFATALFYGDSMITPAMSILSAAEGLKYVNQGFSDWILPISVVIIGALFAFQSRGTAKVGAWFGPIMLVYFATLSGLGIMHLTKMPLIILDVINPMNALYFFYVDGFRAFVAMGTVVLAVTGAEALYADMGHFGRKAIQISWMSLVWPGLMLNYLGQGALLLNNPEAVANPFYLSFPALLLIPAVILSTVVSIIASQAVISGAYSVTQQAIHLGLLPRMHVVHTSNNTAGQIYVPSVNWILLAAVLTVCISFGSSTALASAYGIAVTCAMLIDTLLTFFVVRHKWRYPLWVALGATAFFAIIDLMLVVACSVKIPDGGWFPLVLGLSLFTTMWTWKEGRELLMHHIREGDPNLLDFVRTLGNNSIPRAPRTAVFLVSNPTTVPQALLHNIKHNLTLHEKNLVVTVKFTDEPSVDAGQRLRVHELGNGFWQIAIYFGFSEQPDVPKALELCNEQGLKFELYTASFFISRETVVPSPGKGMAVWREGLFAALQRNAGSVVGYFGLPPTHVIELGTRVHI